jgi:hypothetical protein
VTPARRLARRALLLALPGACLLAPVSARAGDITAFVAQQSPGEEWRTGYGAGLASGLLPLLQLEFEAARTRYERTDTGSMTYFTASLLVAPSLGILTPYGGLGVGLYRQALIETSETNVLTALVFGAKVKIGGLLVVKGEYRKYNLSGTFLIPLEHRYSVGAGISF